MRILFGPENDGLHINPHEPNGYEWWYFDAISDDDRYVLVVIYFLGTPMSPYYKAVADGKNPIPKDWCGVFVSVHERVGSGYREVAYAYNLYTDEVDDTNYFRDKPVGIRLGGTTLDATYSHNGRRFTHGWQLALNERNLWFGTTKASLQFVMPALLDGRPAIESGDACHTWVCVAPDCDVTGDISLGGRVIRFVGRGYHDHNFGRLPWSGVGSWTWNRVHLHSSDDRRRTLIEYNTDYISASGERARRDTNTELVRLLVEGSTVQQSGHASSFGGTGASQVEGAGDGLPHTESRFMGAEATLQRSPFYRRVLTANSASMAGAKSGDQPPAWEGGGVGLGEAFDPARLCGPIISRMMWTRIRRRS